MTSKVFSLCSWLRLWWSEVVVKLVVVKWGLETRDVWYPSWYWNVPHSVVHIVGILLDSRRLEDKEKGTGSVLSLLFKADFKEDSYLFYSFLLDTFTREWMLTPCGNLYPEWQREFICVQTTPFSGSELKILKFLLQIQSKGNRKVHVDSKLDEESLRRWWIITLAKMCWMFKWGQFCAKLHIMHIMCNNPVS